MSNAIRCIDQRFAVKNSSISCLVLIYNLSNPRTTILHAKIWFQPSRLWDTTSHIMFLSGDRYELIAQWSIVSRATWVRFLQGAETLCCTIAHFAWHWARQYTDSHAFILLLSIFLFFWFRQWRSRADRLRQICKFLTLLSDFHCFGEFKLGPGPTHAHMCGPGTSAEIIVIVVPWSWLTTRSVAWFFPDFSKI